MRLIAPTESPELFAIGTHEVQVTWRGADGPVSLQVAAGEPVRRDDPFGAHTLSGLSPGTDYTLTFTGQTTTRTIDFRTLDTPPGPETFRFATMNDLHLGLGSFGLTNRIREPHGSQIARHCARSSFDEAVAWGAEAIVLKGDIVHRAEHAEWDLLTELIDNTPVPVHLTRGNHESAGDRFHISRHRYERMGQPVDPALQVIDVPGIRIVMVDTTVPGSHDGRIGHVADELAALVSDGRPTLVLHHHQMHTVPFPVTYPKGILGRPVRDLLERVGSVNRDVMFASGHTHRHRRHVRAGLTMAELGSTKDYPGTWCGYVAHGGGLVQVVHRIADPEALAWTERTGAAVGGAWSRWSPGQLRDRCFTVEWSGTR